jgi:uncharacterized membrane protein YfcA
MPNRAVHDVFGTATGALTAVLRAGDQPNAHVFLEAFGGCLGGFTASRLPDRIDPPTCPNHRDVAHAVLPVGGVLCTVLELVEQVQKALRSHADSLASERKRSNSMSDFERLWNQIIEWVCRILAGFLAGAVGGYASHLALDMGSVQGLPVLCKGM